MPDGSMQQYEWCDCGSLTKLTDELGHVSKFTYDRAIDRLTSITDAKGNVTRMTYDSAGNALQMIHADGSVESVSNHSAIGLPQTRTNRRGQAVTYTYNAAGQILTRTLNGTDRSVCLRQPRGRIASINSRWDHHVHLRHGDRRRSPETHHISRREVHRIRLRQRRSAHGDCAIRAGSPRATNTTPRDDCFTFATLATTALESYTYDSPGDSAASTRATARSPRTVMTPAGNILSIQNFRSVGVPNSSFTYTYDSRDRAITANTPDGAWTYGYDAAGQLTQRHVRLDERADHQSKHSDHVRRRRQSRVY